MKKITAKIGSDTSKERHMAKTQTIDSLNSTENNIARLNLKKSFIKE